MIVGLLTLALAGACSDATGGQAVPNTGGEETPSGDPQPSSTGGDPTVEIPPRPEDLALDGLEPCATLTEAQVARVAAEFTFDVPPEPVSVDGESYCAVAQSAEPFNEVNILLVTDMGIEHWLSGDGNVDAWQVSIAGYPAVSYKLAGTEDEECVTSVGVADGQQLTVDFQASVDTDYRELCRVTESIATMATETLKTLR